jgi:pre-mRNA-processing factor SLU7
MATRKERRELAELQEQRRLGLAPLAQDSVTGTELGVNVPRTFSDAPWFYGTTGPTLAHQQLSEDEKRKNDVLDDQHGVKTEVLQPSRKFVPGSCTNCGSRTHSAKDCTERKRKVGAKTTREVSGVDRVVQEVRKETFEEKRDLWAGVDSHDALWKKQQQLEAEEASRQELSEAEAKKQRRERDKTENHSHRAGLGTALREPGELPKYLQTAENAYYDPKSRSMRETVTSSVTGYKGDNALNFSGDYATANEQRVYLYHKATKEMAGDAQPAPTSKVIQTTSMFLPTENEQDFKAHKAQETEAAKKLLDVAKSRYQIEEGEADTTFKDDEVEEPPPLDF